MVVKIKFLPPLSRMIGSGELDVEITDGKMKNLIDQLASHSPKLKAALFEEDGSFSLEYTCMVNHKTVTRDALMDTPLDEGDEVTFLMPIAGG